MVEQNARLVRRALEEVFAAGDLDAVHAGCTVGVVEDGVITCPCHGSEFSIEDGSVRHGPATSPLPRRDVRVAGDEISAV